MATMSYGSGKSESAPALAGPFDLRTHIFNGAQELQNENTYRRHDKDGTSYYERPTNSGNLWFENGEPAGRVEVTRNPKGAIVGKKFDLEAKHKAYVAPLAGDAALMEKNSDLEAKLKSAQAELEAIRMENDKKSAPQDANKQTEFGKSIKDSPAEAASAVPKTLSTEKGLGHLPEHAEQLPSSAVGKPPTPDNVHAERAAQEKAHRPASGPGSGPTPDNVHADRAAEPKKSNKDLL